MPVRIPIRVNQPPVSRRASPAGGRPISDAVPPVMDREPVTPAAPARSATDTQRRTVTFQPEPVTPDAERNTQHETRGTQGLEEESLEVWRDRTLRLQAEIENFRKRQQRLAEERILADRERLLRAFLSVADDLERALNADGAGEDSLWQGVDLTYQTLMRLLGQEGVEPIQARGLPFDPAWHEAAGTVPRQQAGAEPNTVVQVERAGYRLGDRLLRPARVVVAV